MSEKELLFSILLGLIVVAVVAIILSVVQWRQITREAQVVTAMRRLRGKKQPSVTVLVYARNQQAHIEQMLRILKNNRYRACDIVVVDDASSDQTAAIVKRFCEVYPKAAIRLFRRRRQTSVSEALRAGYKKSQKGSIVLVMTPDLPLDTQIVKCAVASRGEGGSWRTPVRKGLHAALQLGDVGVFLERYVWQSAQCVRVYDAKMFLKGRIVLPSGIQHEADYVGALSVLFSVVLIAGSIAFFGVQAFWYVWVIVTAYGLATAWLRYGESIRDRLVITLSIPLALFLIPATSIVRGFSQLDVRK